jgi:hypothetical protein
MERDSHGIQVSVTASSRANEWVKAYGVLASIYLSPVTFVDLYLTMNLL